MTNSPIRHPHDKLAPHPQAEVATVGQISGLGECLLILHGKPLHARLASHVPSVIPGQKVLVIHATDIPPLIIAAYPTSEATGAPHQISGGSSLMSFDEATGNLVIEATLLSLRGVAQVELRCGDAVVRLTAQSEIFSQAQAITQAAIGPYRIEGASIDLN